MASIDDLIEPSAGSPSTWRLWGTDIGLLVLRLWFGGAMLIAHGIPKFERLGADPIKFADPLGVGPFMSLVLTLFSEVVCAGLLVLGLGTRIFAVPLVITMVVAAFVVHGDDGFKRQELAITYLAGYLALVFTGPGRLAIDHLLVKRKSGLATSDKVELAD